MFGMLTSLIMAGVWLLTATAMELPVSTTHTIVAGIIGFSLAAEGFESVDWNVCSKIFISWFVSPTFTGILSFMAFGLVKKVVLDVENTFDRAMKTFPFVIFAGVTVNVAFILLKSEKKIAEKKEINDYGIQVVLPCCFGAGLLCALIFWFIVGPRLEKKVKQEQQEHEEALAAEREAASAAKEASSVDTPEEPTVSFTEEAHDPHTDSESDPDHPSEEGKPSNTPTSRGKKIRMSVHDAWNIFAENTYRQDIEAKSFSESKRAREIWESSIATDPETERLFAYLQVFTACLTSFAHGSNDVANAIAAVSAILDVYEHGELRSEAEVQKWLLAMGGAAIW